MKIVIVTDAWYPQINGVVRTLERTCTELQKAGHEVKLISPEGFYTFPCPTYPEIRLSIAVASTLAPEIDAFAPDHVHIATEATLGMAARRYCLSQGIAFTTSYHTRFPEYISARFPIPERWMYAYLRNFHNFGRGCMVATPSLRRELEAQGFTNLLMWSRGVDASFYHPDKKIDLGFEGPVQLYVGRVAVEKNIDSFLSCETPGTKVVVGDGPAREDLQKRFPDAKFLGAKTGEALAAVYASADVFVFPSKTDTFGIVMLEALASGVPVAAYPVMGPADVIGERRDIGVLDNNLTNAIETALSCDRDACRLFAEERSWAATAQLFIDNIKSVRPALTEQLAA
ncbi:MAG: glycosyltransferase family 1 protein [Pseudomonadota bacterium]